MGKFSQVPSFLACFLTGAGLGAVVALLLAPKSGKATRRFLAEKADGSREFVATRGRELRRQAGEYVGKGKEFVAKFA